MIIIMKPQATEEQIGSLCQDLSRQGMQVQRNAGVDCTVLGVLGALGQARARMKKGWRGRALRAGQGLIENIAVLPTMLPEIILGVAFLLLFSALGLPSGMLTLTLAHTTFCMPYVYLLVKSRLATIGDEMENAARDLGATPLRAFITTTLPMTLPSLLAACVLTFLPSVGLIFISDILGGANTVLWGNLVHDELLKSRDLPFAAALSAVLLGLTALVIAVYRRAGGKNEGMVF